MTPERFRQIRNLFEAALDRDVASRIPFLQEASQGDEQLRLEVERLLVAHQQEIGLLDRGPVRSELFAGDLGRMEGRRVDHYEILRELGRGGMGSVYLAVRTDDIYRNPVAFKVLRPEASSHEVIQRFRQERQILAALDHPNISRLLDGGTTPEGLPYFVMDYIEGQPVDTYCDQRRLNIDARLKLFRVVCAAVEYAHQRGVVHRDLKPANILITADGVVKLLDFGIAKLLGTEVDETMACVTRTGMRLMTPEYASPEQVRGETVGAASDIYSLGVILYELLTGHRPYRMPSRLIHEVVRVICEEEPTRPSTVVSQIEQRVLIGDDKPVKMDPQSISQARAATPAELRRQLSGDADKIVLKALRKEPQQRYRTAEALGEDLRRHLEGLPVLARGQDVLYRTGQFLRRYRGWAIAAALLAAGLATGNLKISDWALAYGLFFLITLLGSYWLRRSEVGRDAASRPLFSHAVRLMIPFAVVIAASRFTHYSRQLPTLALLAMTVLCGTILAGWPLRGRWSGPLLLDLRRAKPRAAYIWVSIVSTALVVYITITIAEFRLHKHLDVYPLVFTTGMGLFAAYSFFLWGRVELRQRGMVHYGRLIRWSNIEAYTWEPAEGDLVVLKVHVKRLLPFYRERIILPAKHKTTTEAILSRQLAEWPGPRS